MAYGQYNKQTWVDLPSTTTPISAARMQYLEDAVAAASAQLVTLSGQISSLLAGGVGTTPGTTDATAPAINSFTAALGTTAGAVVLAWSVSDNVAVTRCVVSRSGTTRYDGNGRTFTESGLTGGVAYNWTLTVYDAAGNTRTATATATPATSTSTLAKVTVGTPTISDTSVTVPWTTTLGTDGVTPDSVSSSRDGSDSTGDGAYTATGDPINGSRTFTLLVPGQTYHFTVQLIKAGANYGTPASVTVTVPGAGGGTTGGTGGTTGTPVPVGVPGTWALQWRDEFEGTALDTSRWSKMDGGNMNNVTTRASNISVANSNLILTLSDASTGAEVDSAPYDGAGANGYLVQVGDYIEASIYFPGSGTTIYNWPAFWTSGPNWPAAGEHDIAEGLGTLTVNYHSPSGAHNQGTIPGTWSNAFHTYGLYRKANSADVYWDGNLVKSYPTDDNGAGQAILINVGKSGTVTSGTASQVKVDYVRVWRPA